MRIALAHDSFTQLGGAERVVAAFHEMFPQAPIFTLAIDKKLKEKFSGWDIRTSWLQIVYNFIPKLQFLLPLIPAAVSSLDFSGYDVVLSSSSGFIKNIKLPKTTTHINYCHTPTRFLWSDINYVEQEVPAIFKPLVKPILGWMKKWDYKGAQRVNKFVANSREVEHRIKQYYGRDSEVIYPFVDTDFWKPTISKLDYFLIVGRLQAHKKDDLIVEIFNELGLLLHIAGTGRQENYLKSIAKSNVTFLGQISDGQLRDEYSGAKAVIFPQVEDFGLVPLEAAACGAATLAYGQGGALETVIPGVTGEFFQSYDKSEIKRLILSFKTEKYLTDELRPQAEKFAAAKFKSQIMKIVESKI